MVAFPQEEAAASHKKRLLLLSSSSLLPSPRYSGFLPVPEGDGFQCSSPRRLGLSSWREDRGDGLGHFGQGLLSFLKVAPGIGAFSDILPNLSPNAASKNVQHPSIFSIQGVYIPTPAHTRALTISENIRAVSSSILCHV